MREFFALPFLLLAKGFAEVTTYIDSEPCVCFSLREATEVDEDNVKNVIREMKDKSDD